MNTADLIGLAAGALTTVAFLPQLIKIWRSRSARDLSLGMFAVFNLGLALWLVYGILIGSLPIIIANSVTLVLAGAILYFKLRYP